MSNPIRIFPRWSASWALISESNALARSQCRCCGIQQRVDVSVQAMRFGANASPVDLSDKCNIVGCHGTVFFMVQRAYGRDWITMLSDESLRAGSAQAVPAANAVTLNLVGTGRP